MAELADNKVQLQKTRLGSDDFVARALITPQPRAGFGIAHDLFGDRVPLQRASKSPGDVGQMACAYAPVLTFDVRDGRLSRLDTVKEITHVIDDGIKFAGSRRPIQIVVGVRLEFIARQRM